MSKEEYIEFLQDETRDMMELYYFYYKLKGGSLSLNIFEQSFSIWLMQYVGLSNIGLLQQFVFQELNKHFLV